MLRQISRHPARVVLIILTLALGLGATTAIISAIHGVLLAPLPYPEADRLVTIGELEAEDQSPTVGFTTFDDWSRSLRSFSSIAAVATRSYTLKGDGEPEPIAGLAISHNMFETLGVRPQLGRDFDAADTVRGGPYLALISDELWQRRYGAERDLIGRSILVEDTEFEVIGVMPPRTRIREDEWTGERVDIWVPLRYDVSLPYACRSCRHIRVFGRLREGVTLEQASSEVEAHTSALRRAHPADYPSFGFTIVKPLQAAVVGEQVASSLWIVLIVAAIVLVAAIANAGSLRLSELFSRQNELIVRQAFGATPLRLAGMLIAESVTQALIASLFAIGFAQLSIGWMRTSASTFVPRAADLKLDARVLLVSIALALFAGVVIGILPVLRLRRWSLQTAGRGVVSTRSRAQQLLVGVNIALAVTLLSGGSLLMRSAWNVFSVPPGVDATDVSSFHIAVSGSRYETEEPILHLYDRFIAEAKTTPGIFAVALTSQLPFAEDQDNAGMLAEDRAGQQSPGDAPDAQRFAVTPGYFETLRIPVLGGRPFNDEDRADSEPVVILSESAVRALWADGKALGRRVRIAGGDDNPFRRVIGIVGDVAPGDLGAPRESQAYLPLSQFVAANVTGVARSSVGVEGLRGVMRKLDPEVAFYRIATLSSLIRASEARRTFILLCMGAFAIVTLMLAMIGVYGILSLHVSSRKRELGLRIALGSTGKGVFRLVLVQGLRLVVGAAAIGLLASLILGQFLSAMLYGVSGGDPVTLASVSAVLLLTATVACAIPARRAARLSPIDALREN